MNYTYPEIFHTNPDPREQKIITIFSNKIDFTEKKDLQSPVRCHFENPCKKIYKGKIVGTHTLPM